MKRSDPRAKKLIRAALEDGASRAKIISARDIFVDRRTRLKCLVPRCSSYGSHLLCPPNLMSIDEFREILGCFQSALLLQVEADVNSSDKTAKSLDVSLCEEISFDTDSAEWQNRLLRLVGRMETKAFKMGFYFAAGLSGGDCCLCSVCVTPASGKNCRHPFEARPSMEAMGIDVLKTCKKAGMPVKLSSSSPVRWTGIVLLD